MSISIIITVAGIALNLTGLTGLLILRHTSKPAGSVFYLFTRSEMEELKKKDKRKLTWHEIGYLLVFVGTLSQFLHFIKMC